MSPPSTWTGLVNILMDRVGLKTHSVSQLGWLRQQTCTESSGGQKIKVPARPLSSACPHVQSSLGAHLRPASPSLEDTSHVT